MTTATVKTVEFDQALVEFSNGENKVILRRDNLEELKDLKKGIEVEVLRIDIHYPQRASQWRLKKSWVEKLVNLFS